MNLMKAHHCPGYGPLKEINNQNTGKPNRTITPQSRIKTEPVNKEAIRCDICSKCFSTKWNLERHLKCHLKNNFYPCKMCKDVFFNERGLHSHIRAKHMPVVKMVKTKNEPVNNSYLRYLNGGVNFPMKNAVVRLQRYVERENVVPKNYYCSMCNKSYKVKKSYDNHVKLHLAASFECHLCTKKYSVKKSLEYHMKTKHYNNMFKCTQCKASFAKDSQLKDHAQIHVRDVKIMIKVQTLNNRGFNTNRTEPMAPGRGRKQGQGKDQRSSRKSQNVGKTKKDRSLGKKSGFMCTFCPFQHNSLNGIKRHMHLCKKNITLQIVKTAFDKASTNPKDCHKCTLCSYVSKNMDEMKSHLLQCRGLLAMKPLSVLCVSAV